MQPLLDPNGPHKQNALMEFAIPKGGFKEYSCEDCGKKGHWPKDCPNKIDTSNWVNIKCEICNEISHPTSDCPMKWRHNFADELGTNEE